MLLEERAGVVASHGSRESTYPSNAPAREENDGQEDAEHHDDQNYREQKNDEKALEEDTHSRGSSPEPDK
jgi:hypothetical protein